MCHEGPEGGLIRRWRSAEKEIGDAGQASAQTITNATLFSKSQKYCLERVCVTVMHAIMPVHRYLSTECTATVHQRPISTGMSAAAITSIPTKSCCLRVH
jgi:hypothetical protein